MEHVVYLLGAGFSAPLGLPVVSNFLNRSKDQYALQPEQYEHFGAIFDSIDKLAKTKNYFDANLFDIEEILSILEMRSELEGTEEAAGFSRYIRDVIRYYSPRFDMCELKANWENRLFGENGLHRAYGYLICNLFRLCIRDKGGSENAATHARFDCNVLGSVGARYGVVTLNYDTVLEDLVSLLLPRFHKDTGFVTSFPDAGLDWSDGVALAKLHGTVDHGDLIPPTWSKALRDDVRAAWKLAYQLLSTATQWRIIGYSLPQGDAYVRYLLKSAAMDAPRLKQIDVLCLDPSNHAREQYDQFIRLPDYRFAGRDVLEYLAALVKACSRKSFPDRQNEVSFDALETVHHEFFLAATRRAV